LGTLKGLIEREKERKKPREKGKIKSSSNKETLQGLRKRVSTQDGKLGVREGMGSFRVEGSRMERKPGSWEPMR